MNGAGKTLTKQAGYETVNVRKDEYEDLCCKYRLLVEHSAWQRKKIEELTALTDWQRSKMNSAVTS